MQVASEPTFGLDFGAKSRESHERHDKLQLARKVPPQLIVQGVVRPKWGENVMGDVELLRDEQPGIEDQVSDCAHLIDVLKWQMG